MPASVQQPKAIWWKYKVIINGILMLAAVCAAYWAYQAAREAKQMRFADNLPAFQISSRVDGQVSTDWGLQIRNVGKGPGMLVSFGFTDDPGPANREAANPKRSNPVWWDMRLKECVPPSCPYALTRLNFDEIAKAYAKKARNLELEGPCEFQKFMDIDPQVFGGEPVEGREYYIQFADIFKNQYRQYFYFNGSTKKFVAYGRFAIGPQGDDDPKKWRVDP
jgi:hypothetical protein